MFPYNVFVIRFQDTAAAQSSYSQYRKTLVSENVPFETDSDNGAIHINEQISKP